MRQRLHLLVLCSMIEPTRTNRHIHFGRPPEKFLGTRHDVTTAQVFGLTINTQSLSQFFRTGIDARRQCCGTPLGFTSDSLFITYPTHIITHDSSHSFGLQATNGLYHCIPVIFLLFTVGSFTVCTIKPYFVNFTILRQQLRELFNEELVIDGRIAVTSGIPIPRREVYAKLNTVFIACITQFAYQVSLPATPGTGCNRVPGSLRRPQTKTVAMLGGNDCHLKTSVFECTYPLLTIQFGRIKESRGFRTIPPFTSRKGIDTEMQESGKLHLLPLQLLRSRN